MQIFFLFFISFLIIIGCHTYFEKVMAKRIIKKRKEKIFKLLKNDFEGLKENNFGFFEYKINTKYILFDYTATIYRLSISNHLCVYLDINDLEDDIKKLCKIQFYCSNIENRDYVTMPVEVFYETLNRLSKHSKKTVQEIISNTDYYISQKRDERDKK